ncbi:type IV secretory system conjugative DNA transfer family protein [Leekyejoonella antrihumi]|uniref:Type IV secretory system conjugative DNA transfer family protein n=1 Tax=Leekyejoonella antrihumi TaxID=1660198 RepID=A0A563DWR9_9MICO|nr:type IV secretory system conjugative DNA transfer family protein [Leekyejoonella antrihumi]TWP34411.1 type IV secretory system conjugative DNA transfer family protein [Leekyejoonella antrihumi]
MTPRKPSRSTGPGSGWVFSELHLPRPLEVDQVNGMLLRIAADRAAPLLVFEARAEHNQLVQHLVGTPAEHVVWVQRSLRHLLPGLDIDGMTEPRLPVQRSVHVRLRPPSLALSTERAELTSLSLLSALDARLAEGERLVVQVMLGRRLSPKHLPKELPDPTESWWQMVLRGELSAPTPIRDQIDTRSGQHGFAATIRIGAAAMTPERRQQLMIGILGALSTAQDRGTYVDLRFEPANRFNQPRLPWRWPLRLGATELTGLLGWPLGDRELPGVPPRHPRPLRVPEAVNRSERLFAVPGAPGPSAPVGISAQDLTAHLVTLGPTGSGKSTVLVNLVAADIAAGRPVLVIDPKRQLIRDIVERAVPKERIGDVVIIDPADAKTGRVVGFNPLNVGNRDPDVVIDGLVAVLKQVFHDGWGPRTEDIIHSALLTLARVSATRKVPFTLMDLPRLLTDDRFRRSVIGQVVEDPGLWSFWSSYLAMSPGAQAQAIAAPLNKLRQYLLRPSLRAILGQRDPTFRLRDVFKGNKIVLVPLNEALIGPITAQLLGSLIVAEAWSATLERAEEDDPGSRPASVVIDEVQQYLHLPVSIDDALTRSRSYGVGWHLAHQHRAQLPPSTRAAVDSNAKSKIIFRPLDPDDAAAVARQAPDLQAVDFLSLGKWQAYANLTSDGTPAGWALVRTLPSPEPTGLGGRIRAHSRDHYASEVPQPQRAQPIANNQNRNEAPNGELGRKRRRS